MKLLGSIASPFVRKVRVALAEKSIAYSFSLEDVMGADSAVFALNPLGKIPCLVLDHGPALHDSRVICEYLDGYDSNPMLIPAELRARIAVRRLEALADGILDAGILHRWERTQRVPSRQDPAWLARQELKVERGLEGAARELGERVWCVGQCFSLADIALGCTLGWLVFRFPELDWPQRHPNLARFLERIEARPSFAQTSPR